MRVYCTQNLVPVKNCGVETSWKMKEKVGDHVMLHLTGASNLMLISETYERTLLLHVFKLQQIK
jgi:hypothetical protein